MQDVKPSDEVLREQALVRLRKKMELKAHLLTYVLVNGFFVVIWAFTGAGFFWPIFPMAGWAIGVFFHVWDVYRREEPTEQEISREIESLRERR